MQRQTQEETEHAEAGTGRDRTCRDIHRKRKNTQRQTQEETEHAETDTGRDRTCRDKHRKRQNMQMGTQILDKKKRPTGGETDSNAGSKLHSSPM
jgi:hypothetical protein